MYVYLSNKNMEKLNDSLMQKGRIGREKQVRPCPSFISALVWDGSDSTRLGGKLFSFTDCGFSLWPHFLGQKKKSEE